MLLININD
ncbi:Protein of unknown function [Leuconostoc citreum]|nr:Protein of unknown function [Leuconostoc citreum LBAE C10]CCF26087.1 Protein of unknown function [Leuconostoc citreum LBAE C11]CCF27898.1 Protein of unknown function [Leuconostoc citreum LBAE E16]CDX65413.1 Protein of unknown function [Leuconostoc citreum]CDX67183.1 Protein of unknown function [Leuconostoc citreum]